MLCNIKPVPIHESDKHIFAKIPGGVRTPGPPPLDPPMKNTDKWGCSYLRNCSLRAISLFPTLFSTAVVDESN